MQRYEIYTRCRTEGQWNDRLKMAHLTARCQAAVSITVDRLVLLETGYLGSSHYTVLLMLCHRLSQTQWTKMVLHVMPYMAWAQKPDGNHKTMEKGQTHRQKGWGWVGSAHSGSVPTTATAWNPNTFVRSQLVSGEGDALGCEHLGQGSMLSV